MARFQPNETTNSEYRYNDQNERNSNVDATESDYRMSYTDRLNRFENGNQDSRWSWGVTNTWGNSNFGWNNGFNNNWGWNSGFNNNWGWGNSFNDPWFGIITLGTILVGIMDGTIILVGEIVGIPLSGEIRW